jgi:sulfate transport system permease protein
MAFSYVGFMVLVPVGVVAIKGLGGGWELFWESISHPIARSALEVTLRTAAIMALINTLVGTLTAYFLVKYRFPGKGLFNMLIDLPFAIPTLVTGLMLVLLYGPQTEAAQWLDENFGQRILYSQNGIILALLFVGYPFVIRTVQPVLMALPLNQEEAAHNLGASDWQTFWRVIFPALRPAIISGGLLSFARSLGEFGSIIIVAGNIPMRSQTATVYIYAQVEGGNLPAASSVSLVLILISLAVALGVKLWGVQRA